ncbi:MAG: ATP-binding cassette domain-containing protein [Oscillospiraceae bacterium]|nr:ATP-binding cassette domain-containing protein [Oscillospiraceae bacterium]
MKYSHVKVPLIMQMEYVECGAASLAMILAYHGKYVPLEQVRRDCGVSRDGSKASNLMTAAENYGLVAEGYRWSVESVMTKAHIPCIIHWNMAHFVVLRGFGKNKAYLNDPGLGEITVSMEEFNRSFTGIVLEFRPGENFVRDGKMPTVGGYLRSKAAQYRSGLVFLALDALAVALIGLMTPVYQRIFTDVMLNSKQVWVRQFFLTLLLLGVLELVSDLLRETHIYRIQGNMAMRSNTGFFRHLLNLPTEFYQQRSVGDLISRLTMNSTIAELLVRKITPVAIQMVMVLIYFIALFSLSPVAAFLGAFALAGNILTTWFLARYTLQSQQRRMNSQMRMDAAMISGIDMIETIKSSGVANGYFSRWAGQQAEVNAGRTKENSITVWLTGLATFMLDLTNALVLSVAAWSIIHGYTTVGLILVLQTLIQKLTAPAQDLSQVSKNTRELATSIQKVEDVMNYAEDGAFPVRTLPEGEEIQPLDGGIAFEHVTFGYSRVAPPLLDDFSFTVQPGQRIAVVGASGSGKSTVAKLLTGTVLPWSGEVLFDGRPRASIPKTLFADAVAIVSQESTLFEDTVSNNIRMWDTKRSSTAVVRAAREACIHDDILMLPGGYDYVVRSGGKNFSGGQCQRITIARALARNPKVLILDEATSALDAKTEHVIMENIKARKLTAVIVAHRLSTVRDCDCILVLDNGKIAEQGTHDELMKLRGKYYTLVSSQ